MVEVYTDASYDDNKRICGMGIVIQDGVKQKTISNWCTTDSVHYGEMFAIYMAAVQLAERMPQSIQILL